MHSTQEVERLLLDAGIPVSGSAIRNSGSQGFNYYVFVEVHRSARGRQEPTNTALDAVKTSLQNKGVLVEFVLTDGTTRDAESGLRATLLYSFRRMLRNVFLSTKVKDAFVWVVPKRRLNDTELDRIEAAARTFLASVGLKLNSITTTTGEDLPSRTRCLVMLRQAAPVTCSQLAALLRAKEFVVPSDDWLTRTLDALRKAGLVVRMKSGRYALSLQALKGLGTVKGRASPDVSRLLALAANRG